MAGWKILRTKPIGKRYGRAFASFIRNGDYYFDLLAVYADGAVDCWGMLDLPLFRDKAATGWIAPQPPAGARIGFHNLGAAKIAATEWQVSVADLVALAEAAVAELNPRGVDLVDLEGEATLPYGENSKARIAKLGMADRRFYRVDAAGGEVLGAGVPLLVRDGDGWIVSPCAVYADGTAQLRPDGPAEPIESIIAGLECGDLATAAPDGAWLRIDGLGRARIGQGFWGIDPAERIREIRDEIDRLNGAPGAIKVCIAQHEAYKADPSPANKERLRAAYEAVPEHRRMYCGDMDSKDWPIRWIIYGERDPYGADDDDE